MKTIFDIKVIISRIFRKRKQKTCYHKWHYFNHWCQECSKFTKQRNHGTLVSYCSKCGNYYDKEFGFWSLSDIENIFFNKFEHIITKKEMIINAKTI